jgi:ABC-type amino acid transport substrate-binding protein
MKEEEAMKRFLIAVSVLVLIFSLALVPAEAKTLAGIIKEGKIVIGVKADYPPWSAINEKSEFEGWEIDLCHKLAEYLFADPNKVEFVAVTPESRIKLLTSGKIDIIWATMGITSQRAEKLQFSIPYFESGVRLLAKKGSGINSIYDLKGKNVITIKGTTGAQALAELVPGAKQIKFIKPYEALQALRNDQGIAFAQDDLFVFTMALYNPDLEVVGEYFNTTDWGVGIPKGEDDVKAFVDVSLRLMYESGYLQDSLRKWWGGGVLDEYLRRIEKVFQE